jgi:hypothetical protein
VGAQLRIPAGEQDGGVVLQNIVLVTHDGVDQAADGLGWGVVRGGLASEEVDQAVLSEEVARFVAGLGDAVMNRVFSRTRRVCAAAVRALTRHGRPGSRRPPTQHLQASALELEGWLATRPTLPQSCTT